MVWALCQNREGMEKMIDLLILIVVVANFAIAVWPQTSKEKIKELIAKVKS